MHAAAPLTHLGVSEEGGLDGDGGRGIKLSRPGAGERGSALERTQVQFPVPASRGSQLPVTQAPGDLSLSASSLGTSAHVHIKTKEF